MLAEEIQTRLRRALDAPFQCIVPRHRRLLAAVTLAVTALLAATAVDDAGAATTGLTDPANSVIINR